MRARHTKRSDGLCRKQLVGVPWRIAFALQDDGWVLRSDIIWHKPNTIPENVKDRPTRAHEYLFLFSKTRTYYYYDRDAILEPDKGDSEGVDAMKTVFVVHRDVDYEFGHVIDVCETHMGAVEAAKTFIAEQRHSQYERHGASTWHSGDSETISIDAWEVKP